MFIEQGGIQDQLAPLGAQCKELIITLLKELKKLRNRLSL
jgi:hypothetical protein